MLKQVLTHFIDSDIKHKKEEEKALLLEKREKEFNKGADIVVSNMIKRCKPVIYLNLQKRQEQQLR